jgi:hypothetical protein
MAEAIALDVWLKFSEEDDEEAAYEANTYRDGVGDYRVEWYHTAVGQISFKIFASYAEAAQWLEDNGFIDFTS